MCLAKSRVGDGVSRRVVAFVLAFLFLGLTQTQAQQGGVSSDSERGSAAIGHYARARALIIEALAEFELGKRLADPDMLFSSEQWRMTLVSRAEELNTILDPKPRITRSGVHYKANSRFIREDRNLTTDEAKIYPKSDNANHEALPAKAKDKKVNKIEASKPVTKAPVKEKLTPAPVKREPQEQIEEEIEENEEPAEVSGKASAVHKTRTSVVNEGEKAESDLPHAKASKEVSSEVVKKEVNPNNSVFPVEQSEAKANEAEADLDVNKAIEAVIQEKLQNLETKQKQGGTVKQ